MVFCPLEWHLGDKRGQGHKFFCPLEKVSNSNSRQTEGTTGDKLGDKKGARRKVRGQTYTPLFRGGILSPTLSGLEICKQRRLKKMIKWIRRWLYRKFKIGGSE